MELTGKCKEDFEEWYAFLHLGSLKLGIKTRHKIKDFYTKHSSMKYGVYIDFFDNVEVLIDITSNLGYTYNNSVYFKGKEYNISMMASRDIARTKAIEKANKIYNVSKHHR